MDQKPANTLGYKITIGVLVAIIAVMAYMLMNQKKEVITITKTSNEEKVTLQEQLDSLLMEHEKVKAA